MGQFEPTRNIFLASRGCVAPARAIFPAWQSSIPRPRDPLALAKLIGDFAAGQVVDGVEDGKDAAG